MSRLARRSGLAALLLGLGLAAWLVLQRAPDERGRRSDAAQPGPTPARGALEPLRAAPQLADEARAAVPSPAHAARLAVRVLASDGQPLGGLEVVLLVVRSDGTTAARARAVTRPADGLAELTLDPPGDAPVGHRLLCPAGFWPPPALELGPTLPEEPLTLFLPAHGALSVRLQRDGQPVEHAARVFLSAVSFPDDPPRELPARAGLAHLAALGLGLELEVHATCEESGPTEPVRLAGPRRAGEEVPLVLELGPLWPRVRLQVLAGDGSPLSLARFEGWIDYGNRSAPLTSAPLSDADGWLVFRLPGDVPEHGSRALVLRRTEADEPELRARLTLPDPLDGERVHDLGQLRFPAPGKR